MCLSPRLYASRLFSTLLSIVMSAIKFNVHPPLSLSPKLSFYFNQNVYAKSLLKEWNLNVVQGTFVTGNRQFLRAYQQRSKN